MKFSRRTFISAAFLLSLGASPKAAKAWFPHGYAAPVFPATFGGNPNAVISSINTSGGIVLSRTSGNCVPANATISSPGSPAYVQVSASAITCVGTITAPSGAQISASALSDLEFTWNFGDPSGTEIFVAPTDGNSYNANTAQTAGEAAYAYRTAGTKTITLNIRGKNGSGGYVTASVTATFTVSDLTQAAGFKSWYVDSVNGNDAWDGTAPQFVSGTIGPKATVQKTNGANHGLMGVATNTSCCFLARGSSWQDQGNIFLPTTNAAVQLLQSSIRFSSYVGATSSSVAPQIAISGTTTNSNPLNIGNGSNGFGAGTPVNDIVVSSINFVTNGGTLPPCTLAGSCSEDPSATMLDLYLDNCVFTQTSGMTSSIGNNQGGPWCRLFNPWACDTQRLGIWGCSFISPSVGTNSPINAGIAPAASQWFFNVGCNVAGDGNDNIRGHSSYSHVGSHLLNRWYSNKPAGVDTTFGLNYALNIESDPIPANLSSGVLGCGFLGTIPAGSGAGASVTLTIKSWKGPLSINVGMMVQMNGLNHPSQISAGLSTSINSFTYSAGVGTITVSAGHNVTTGSKLAITVSGADAGYNGSYTATATSSTVLTVSMANPGSSSATVPGSYVGGSFTLTPTTADTLPAVSNGGFAAINLDAMLQGNYTASTKTFAITSGTEFFGNGTTDIQVGDIVVFPGSVGSSPLLWAPINAVIGTPATSFTVNPHTGFNFANGTAVLIYILPANGTTVVNSTVLSGCLLATTQGGHSGNSSTNDASYLYYTDFVCENSAFENLQLDGSVANCLQSYTMRNCRAWGSVNNPVDGIFDLTCSTGNMAATVAWRVYGNKQYNTFSSLFFGDNNQSPTSTLPLQFTDNELWNTNASGILVSLNAPSHANSIIDRNDYNAPSHSTFLIDAAAGTQVSFSTWQALGINFDPNSTNVNSATPATGPMASWTVPITSWAGFGP